MWSPMVCCWFWAARCSVGLHYVQAPDDLLCCVILILYNGVVNNLECVFFFSLDESRSSEEWD